MFGLRFSPRTSQIALPSALEPRLPLGRVPRGRHAPVREVLPVDVSDGAQALRVLALLGRAHDRDGLRAREGDELHRERAQPARGPPHEHDVVRLHRVRRPAVEHPVGGRAGERGRRGLLPREVIGLRQALVGLNLAELRERPPARVVAPDAERRREAGVAPRRDPRVVQVPLPGVHDDTVADLHVRHLGADRVHDARRVRADDVEVGGLAPASLRLRHVDRDAAGRPHVVEVHARSHDHHERVLRAELGDLDDLVADRVARLPEPVGPDELGVHLPRNLTDRWDLADPVQILAHASTPHAHRRTRAP